MRVLREPVSEPLGLTVTWFDHPDSVPVGSARSGGWSLVRDVEGQVALLVDLCVERFVLEYGRGRRFDEDAGSALFDHLIAGHRAFGQGELESRRSGTRLHDAQAGVNGQVRLRRQTADRRGGAVGDREHWPAPPYRIRATGLAVPTAGRAEPAVPAFSTALSMTRPAAEDGPRP